MKRRKHGWHLRALAGVATILMIVAYRAGVRNRAGMIMIMMMTAWGHSRPP